MEEEKNGGNTSRRKINEARNVGHLSANESGPITGRVRPLAVATPHEVIVFRGKTAASTSKDLAGAGETNAVASGRGLEAPATWCRGTSSTTPLIAEARDRTTTSRAGAGRATAGKESIRRSTGRTSTSGSRIANAAPSINPLAPCASAIVGACTIASVATGAKGAVTASGVATLESHATPNARATSLAAASITRTATTRGTEIDDGLGGTSGGHTIFPARGQADRWSVARRPSIAAASLTREGAAAATTGIRS